MSGRQLGMVGVALVIVGAVLVGAGAVVASGPQVGGSRWPVGMMGGNAAGQGTMGAYAAGPGMMGAYTSRGTLDAGTQPGDPGFVAGTASRPRVIRVVAGPGYTFSPASITVQRGETITFEVTTMGPLVHEFMVGPADAVAADAEGTPEVADIGMMQTRTLTYAFDGGGPYAFACHAPGHYEAGMHGTIAIVG
jgi:uncharacterized cupredoxin-like copper-binding protein